MAKNLIVILGPTASGKTRMAAQLAHDLNSETISADSRQVYRGMNIGTGKDLSEYNVEGKCIPYHLIDIINPDEEFNLFEYQKKFYEVYIKIIRKNKIPVLVGGTGLYLESILLGYQLSPAFPDTEFRGMLKTKSIDELRETLLELKPQLHNKTDCEDKNRLIRAIEIERARKAGSAADIAKPLIDAAVFGIHWERSILRKRITARLKERLENGMIAEVKSLQLSGLKWERLDSFGLEYRYIAQYLQGKIDYSEMFLKLNTSIHQFAKRQETWFRRMERKGIRINWIGGDDYNLLLKLLFQKQSV
jgi:tRNA dimethylallyltransferase